jgi:hypothetical protein
VNEFRLNISQIGSSIYETEGLVIWKLMNEFRLNISQIRSSISIYIKSKGVHIEY